ncbi:tRNA epoxyqueuosine(34) reductase QueG [Rheinheimera sediminis]|uniref:tRNA epoxyqueuosine(34) reductase QueG n=1 Tax=Rheinheimera sp. YQF-1 TaxID=2499626 RepID=UPI000FDA58D2|nr:tRNA epoxyqueuosine(34) reductase QueG [Rheinheimera sp. YQF-1]RVT47881.1 tRNA epoxyqueuosine(34) reductase QueG [Rheinheimera sp. YQF-1]
MTSTINWLHLAEQIKVWGQQLGFQQIGITDTDLASEEAKLQQWLDDGFHGEMEYMAAHGMKRARPAELHPGTIRVISARMDYLPEHAQFAANLADPSMAYISRYALGRDYHKLIRNRLKQLGERIEKELGALGFRPFVDSAPILERPLAIKAGLGWQGKHSLVLNQDAGSWFFLGELLVDIPLPVDAVHTGDCGACVACITICPTQAIVAPYTVDARRCISYLTIELQGAIPEEFRSLLGNRIYGCDDCQLVCPVNRAADTTQEQDFQRRPQWLNKSLLDLWRWTETEFLKYTEGSAIRRIGYQRWQRNIAVALGNAPFDLAIIEALQQQQPQSDELVSEHIQWALLQQQKKSLLQQNLLSRQTDRLIRAIQKGLPRDA